MSKILEALKKVSHLRNETGENQNTIAQGAPGSRKAISGVHPIFQNTMLVIVTLIGMVSLSFSVRVLSEMKKNNIASINFYSELIAQKKKIDGFSTALSDLQAKQALQVNSLKTKYDTLSALQKETDTELRKVISTHGEFRGAIKDLKWTTENIAEKMTSMNTELNNLKPNQN